MDNSNFEKQCSFCVFLILLRLYDVLETTWCPSKHDLKYHIYIDLCYMKIKQKSLENSKHQLKKIILLYLPKNISLMIRYQLSTTLSTTVLYCYYVLQTKTFFTKWPRGSVIKSDTKKDLPKIICVWAWH